MRTGELVEHEPLPGRDDTARRPHPHHERIERLELPAAPLVAQVAVVLLVTAMELDELRVAVGECAGDRIREALHDRAAQIIARLLDALDLRSAGRRLRRLIHGYP